MKFLIIAGLLLFASVAKAEEISVVAHGLSYHTTNASDYNQENFGLGLRLDFSNIAVQAGSYKNSYSQNSNYLALDLNLWKYSVSDQLKFELGPMLGLATGYPDYDLILGPGLQAAVKYDNFYIRSRMMPALTTPLVVSVELGYTLFRF